MIAGSTLPVALLPVATPNLASALPLYQFVNTGSGPLPWNAVSFESEIDNINMLGGPHAVSQNGETALTYEMANRQIGLYTQGTNGPTSWVNISTLASTPTPSSDPIPFFDPMGNVDILYVDSSNHLILITPNQRLSPRSDKVASPMPWHPYVVTDLTLSTGVGAASAIPCVSVNGLGGFVAFRSLANNAEVVPLSWVVDQRIPTIGAAANVSSITGAGAIANSPVAFSTGTDAFAATSSTGFVEVFTNIATSTAAWSVQNLTTLTSTAVSAGALAVTSTASTSYVAALTATGNVELYSTPFTTFLPAVSSHTAPVAPLAWTATNVNAFATGAPPLDGAIFMTASSGQLSIAGQAANWGDLFVLTNTIGTLNWSATDVSVTAGTAARTVGPVVTGAMIGTKLDLFAAGVSSPPKQGVGLYAIPQKDWGLAVTDGWPILSDTGGLGTRSAPWVGFTSATSVATSPDFLLGQSIYNSHKRVTWLSFWTVSGPLANEKQTSATYYSHGFASGVWVAQQIDQYRGLGVGLKPDWVIFDPEGYPDNHSGLDAPGGSSKATIATNATYWASMLQGWVQGIASIDSSLKAGVYTSQSEYANYKLVNQSLPVFMAVAFAGGGPVQVTGASGSNVRGYIAFDAVCMPTSTLKSQESTLAGPPWWGQFNTLQFNAGVYCPPA